MRLLFAVGLALSLAWLWGRLLRFLNWDQRYRVGIGAPLGEEAIKYYMAIIFHLQPWLLYLWFGVGEGCFEAYRLRRPLLILAGGLTHFGFGILFLFPFPSGLSFGYAIIAHLFWNNLLLRD